MGFPGTTGLQAMDYYLSDQFFLPSGQFDDQFTEKIVHLPASAAFQPSLDAPPVNALPAQDNGYVTFGSFNRPAKISRAVVALWSQLLRAMPSSRMVLGAMPKEGQRNAVLEWFDQEGIDHKRLSIYEVCGMKDYQALHHQVDICLDTFPYNGGTTTLHALWMGVPTLTLVGGTPAGRTGASILGHVGLHAYMATDADEFVQKGLQLAGDLAALSDLRAQLRGRFAESAMGQPAVVAAGLEQALRTMWQRWCDDRAPVAFTVI
jgi:predicted O-linked N-acetylglucosamine transferase (SPINDLY family)